LVPDQSGITGRAGALRTRRACRLDPAYADMGYDGPSLARPMTGGREPRARAAIPVVLGRQAPRRHEGIPDARRLRLGKAMHFWDSVTRPRAASSSVAGERRPAVTGAAGRPSAER